MNCVEYSNKGNFNEKSVYSV